MKAEDYDDASEGTNALLSYSIEKNAFDEKTGEQIFMIERESGIIRTLVCCLDREQTSNYRLEVVAMDGGGLRESRININFSIFENLTATATASIVVLDINDRPPRFTQNEWFVEIEETIGSSVSDQDILTVSVHDDDANNTFTYKVVNSSGFGADKFTIMPNTDGTGSLRVIKPLDFEDPNQSGGFKFQIQVTDYNNSRTGDKNHTAKAWVVIKLIDVNDNEPQFFQSNTQVQVFENTPAGRQLTSMRARDPDRKGKSKVYYMIERSSDQHRIFHIDRSGTVSLQRTLDREATPFHVIKILAVDDGLPAKTATASITIVVMDINDCAPELAEQSNSIILENLPPQKIADIAAIDKDDPAAQHGPPFHFILDPAAADKIHSSFRIENIPEGDNGNGVARIFSLRKFDRETQKVYHVPIIIKDSGKPSLTGTSTLTVVIGDINDNLMEPGTKEVMFYSYRGRAHQTKVGQVYVHDPDDWDLGDKKFMWVTHPHPNFILDEDNGMLTMRYATSDTSYSANFLVNDHRHAQFNVNSSVDVKVRIVSELALYNAGSVRFENITDEDFVRKWDHRTEQPLYSKLQKFGEIIARIFGVESKSVAIFSVQLKQKKPPLTDVFFSVYDSNYLQSTKINSFMLKYKAQIEHEMQLPIAIIGIDACLPENVSCDGSCTSEIKIFDTHYLIDANRTAYVGVNVQMVPQCVCSARNFSAKESCYPNPCHNGGQCKESKYNVHCQCPEGFNGPSCQMLERTFRGDGFAWFPPLKSCERSHLSVEFLTLELHGLILYNGPFELHDKSHHLVSDFIALELNAGRLKLLINFGSGTLELDVSTSEALNDGRWHTADIYWDREVRKVVK
ncbi:Cadherin [Halocaridina rubra]|uniref:Cadherin n=1 Tax=Halocaridina rubra TaxID=373956 RepID=A0AAN8WJC2_HALRR